MLQAAGRKPVRFSKALVFAKSVFQRKVMDTLNRDTIKEIVKAVNGTKTSFLKLLTQ